MTINWLYAQTIDGKIEFPNIWNSSGILISISNIVTPEWRKMGLLKVEALIDGIFFEAELKPIRYGDSLIHIPYNAYRLSFEPVDLLLISHPNIQIKIAEFNFNMYVSPSENVNPQLGEPIYTTVIPALPTSQVPVFSLAPIRERRSVLITNKTNKTMYIKEGAAASTPALVAADPFTSIAAGASYTVEDWNGEIVGLMSASFANGGKVIVKELPYFVEEVTEPPAA
jgi:hypothetical protein